MGTLHDSTPHREAETLRWIECGQGPMAGPIVIDRAMSIARCSRVRLPPVLLILQQIVPPLLGLLGLLKLLSGLTWRTVEYFITVHLTMKAYPFCL